jgi:hypothetical protein
MALREFFIKVVLMQGSSVTLEAWFGAASPCVSLFPARREQCVSPVWHWLLLCWLSCCYFYFCDVGDWTQSLAHTRQALYYWAALPTLICLVTVILCRPVWLQTRDPSAQSPECCELQAMHYHFWPSFWFLGILLWLAIGIANSKFKNKSTD